MKSLQTFGIEVPCPFVAGKVPELCHLRLSRLRIDPAYQRDITARGRQTIRHIAANFQWARFAPLIVTPLPGGDLFAIIDGQHRATAALIRGFDAVPCQIVACGDGEAAAIFAAVNGTVTPLSILALFKAARLAGEDWAVAVDQACAMAGIEPLTYPVAKSNMKPRQTLAIGTLRKEVVRHGADVVGAVLRMEMVRPGADEPGYLSSDRIRHAMTERLAADGLLPGRAGDMDVTLNGRSFRLTAAEYRVFEALDAADTVAFDGLLAAWRGSVRGLERIIQSLSRRFATAGAEIVFFPGEGYRLQNIEEAAA